ncbi:hypothetical protein G9A89_008210 [Geosiphon pyriformis]|nr:hypothetical protein G9A89_008210 [Geosiphon pyriformis]
MPKMYYQLLRAPNITILISHQVYLALQRYTKVVTIRTIEKNHSFDFCNYINTKINCLLGHITDTGRLEKQIHQSLLGYSTTTITQAIAETLCIVDTNIKHYITKQFSQIQQPVESDPEEYKYRSNNLTTAQDKSMINKKPRFLSLTIPSYHQTLQSSIVFNPPLETLEIHTFGVNKVGPNH